MPSLGARIAQTIVVCPQGYFTPNHRVFLKVQFECLTLAGFRVFIPEAKFSLHMATPNSVT